MIVAAAITIADAEGLTAVTLRRVGSALEAGPMRLYGYMATKDELLELMVDAVYGEMVSPAPLPIEWRQSVRLIAQRTRSVCLRHPWFADLIGGRPHQGPCALTYLETLVASLGEQHGFHGIDASLLAAKAINAYLVGAIRSEVSEVLAERESGMDKREWQKATGPYLMRQIASGRFPTLKRIIEQSGDPAAETLFEIGLECMLDGIGARLLA